MSVSPVPAVCNPPPIAVVPDRSAVRSAVEGIHEEDNAFIQAWAKETQGILKMIVMWSRDRRQATRFIITIFYEEIAYILLLIFDYFTMLTFLREFGWVVVGFL